MQLLETQTFHLMKKTLNVLFAATTGLLALNILAQSDAPYKVLDTTKIMGNGGIDYVYADNDERRVYVPRGTNTYVFDLDTHKYIGAITNIYGPETMQKIKNIEVPNRPDGILFEPMTRKVYIFSHGSPSVVVIDPADGTVAGTIDIGGSMEQAQSDGQGHVYADIEDQKQIAVIDVNTLKVTTKYDLGDGAGDPGGLGLDAKNHILFAMCADPSVCVIVNADTGKVLATLPIGDGTDGGGFNPNTMEAWSSQRDGTMTIIKESSPTSFAVEQTVQTKVGCKTSSLDSKNNDIITICTERLPQSASAAPATPPPAPMTNAPAGGRRRMGGGRGGPGNLDVLWVGR
jgi:DNA-binding beta-propeller fold protein YncE